MITDDKLVCKHAVLGRMCDGIDIFTA